MEKILSMNKISKRFGGIKALDDVDVDLYEGEVHAICGENGAGKSTLMKILAGNFKEDSGEILIDGKKVDITNPRIAESHGIAIVYQELSLSPSITVAENIFLGREIKNKLGLLDKKLMAQKAREYLKKVNCNVNPQDLVLTLTVAKQQLVQIAKALSSNARIIILDEPFSALSDEDSINLFEVIKQLKTSGISIIYIDHRIDNFFMIADRVTVLRDGEKVSTNRIEDLNKKEIIKKMVGREIKDIFPKRTIEPGDFRFEVIGLSNKKIHNISFKARAGEVLGLGGLVGSGRTEIMNAICGIDKLSQGKIYIDGTQVRVKKSADAVELGIGYVSEDRKGNGLVLIKDVKYNASLVTLDQLNRMGFIDKRKEIKTVKEYIQKLKIKTSGLGAIVSSLSGGNQQKVVIAKWLMLNNLKVLLLDEPTRGIDVGAKFEIYKLINELAASGITIILVTSELQELLGLCDRIMVIRDGLISGELSKEEASQEAVMQLCI